MARLVVWLEAASDHAADVVRYGQPAKLAGRIGLYARQQRVYSLGHSSQSCPIAPCNAHRVSGSLEIAGYIMRSDGGASHKRRSIFSSAGTLKEIT